MVNEGQKANHFTSWDLLLKVSLRLNVSIGLDFRPSIRRLFQDELLGNRTHLGDLGILLR